MRLIAALASLRAEGVLVVAAGMSFHNMRVFFERGAVADARSVAFDSWLRRAVRGGGAAAARRRARRSTSGRPRRARGSRTRGRGTSSR